MSTAFERLAQKYAALSRRRRADVRKALVDQFAPVAQAKWLSLFPGVPRRDLVARKWRGHGIEVGWVVWGNDAQKSRARMEPYLEQLRAWLHVELYPLIRGQMLEALR